MLKGLSKLRDSLSKTRDNLFGKINLALGFKKLDDETLDNIEESLLQADLGVGATTRIIDEIRSRARRELLSNSDEALNLLKEEIRTILTSARKEPLLNGSGSLVVFLVVGVNGSGKTTTIGKLAKLHSQNGKKVMIAACDTFRAAAVEQLQTWAMRSGVEFTRSHDNADPAAVAYDATISADAKGMDLLLVDTAGRLHTKSNLMQELSKIRRVIEKADPQATIRTLLVIDGTTGQNALKQVEAFTAAAGCDGLIVTKLDGTAKGGVVVAIAQELEAPVRYICIGEGIDDIQEFDAAEFAEALLE
ncbi:MAG: signal recognition particle-docking protein FtsY [candidate division Zixibacteria bacterium]|nr:signal recognition particle-docking protein FtsY [candidate division Zixibacteria bacterium]